MNYAVPRDYLNDVNPAISAHVAVDDLPLAEVPGIECLSSVTEVLAYRAWRQPDAIAFIHLLDGEREEASISYAELWKRSQRLAAALQIFEPREKRVLMLFETGIDYIVSLFGLLLAGAVAIPAFPPVLSLIHI